jgi:SAM-dependent methyltransferase
MFLPRLRRRFRDVARKGKQALLRGCATPPVEATLSSEDQRYSRLFKEGYGIGPIDRVWQFAQSRGILREIASVLDVGCGRGPALRRFSRLPGVRAVGVDISTYVINLLRKEGYEVYRADCRELASLFAGTRFDLVWSCDMLEHLPPAWVDDAIKAMWDVCARRLLVNVSTRASTICDAYGRNLHLTVKPANWWRSRLECHAFRMQDAHEGADEWTAVFTRA